MTTMTPTPAVPTGIAGVVRVANQLADMTAPVRRVAADGERITARLDAERGRRDRFALVRSARRADRRAERGDDGGFWASLAAALWAAADALAVVFGVETPDDDRPMWVAYLRRPVIMSPVADLLAPGALLCAPGAPPAGGGVRILFGH